MQTTGATVPPVSRGHYFEADPAVASAPVRVELALPDLTLRLWTDRGVFSPDHVDTVTRVLLAEAPPLPAVGTFVDVGCGYGPIALTMARRSPAATVWAVDVNARARELCTRNAAEAACDNVVVVAPEEVPDDLVVDRLWSNPPVRVGKAALRELLLGWLDRLAPTGVAHLVVQKHLGADSLAAWLDEQGWPTARLASRQAFRVLEVRPRPPARVTTHEEVP